MPINLHKNSHIVKSIAEQLGFDQCGIAKAERLDEDARRLEKWLNKGFHGEMTYMENHFDMRVDPTKLVPGAKSVITLLCNYFPKEINFSVDWNTKTISGTLKDNLHKIRSFKGFRI